MSTPPKYPFADKIESLKKDFLSFWKNLQKLQDIFKANFDMGKRHYELGNFADAIFRFKFVLWLDPKYAAGWYWLGLSQLADGKKNEGIKSLEKARSLRPDWQEVSAAIARAGEAKND